MNFTHCGALPPSCLIDVIRAVLGKSPISYMILDKNYRVHFVNDYFETLHGIPAEAVVGNHCYNIFNREPVVCEECPVREAIATGEQADVARKNILRNGKVRYADESAVPLADENGDFDLILDVLVNRTEEMVLREGHSRLFMRIVEILTSILDKKDAYTYYHSRNVTRIAVRFARFIGMEEGPLHDLHLASLLHDIGKVYTPDAIIKKPGGLTDDELRQIRRHPEETYRLLDNLSRFEEVKTIARHHHERWDGGGYPDGLAGESIPFSSRIIAVADAYDAMTSNRSYRRALSHEHAVGEIRGNAGAQFDPSLARLFGELADTQTTSRKDLLGVNPDPFERPARSRRHVIRKMDAEPRGAAGAAGRREIDDVFAAPSFFAELEESIPGFLFVVDGGLRLLHAGEKAGRGLSVDRKAKRPLRCPDLIHGPKCCAVSNTEPCPLMRSIASGDMESGKMSAELGGEKKVFAALSIPVKLDDRGGRRRAYVAILLDRTREEREYAAIEKDTRSLLFKLYVVAMKVNGADAAGMDAIMRECDNFGEYLSGVRRRLQGLSHTSQIFRPLAADPAAMVGEIN